MPSTTFPIAVTTDRLVEFHGLADILCSEELGRLPSHTTDDPVAEIIELMALQGQTGDQIRAWLHDTPEAIAHREKPPVPPLPPVPTREQLLTGQVTLQGMVIHTTKYGDMPWWGACWPWLDSMTRKEAAQQLLAAGETICLLGVPMGGPLYNEDGNFYSPDKFPALSMTDAEVIAMANEAVALGFSGLWMFLSGDDGAAGYQVATEQVKRLAPQFGDLNQRTVWIPGWDGVWHAPMPNVGTGYTPQMIRQWSIDARAAGAIYLGLEHGTGYLPCGEGGADFQPGGVMSGYDLVLGEFDDDRFDGSVWQILARFLGPSYVRPPDQIAHDVPGDPLYPQAHDPNPLWIIREPSERGPYIYRVFEYFIYGFVRNTPAEHVLAVKRYFEACGAQHVC